MDCTPVLPPAPKMDRETRKKEGLASKLEKKKTKFPICKKARSGGSPSTRKERGDIPAMLPDQRREQGYPYGEKNMYSEVQED